jgi:O-antigen/teichoic acid export membrane protein
MNTEVENRAAGLRERSLKAVVWSSADTFGRQGIQFVTSILLARLLTPKEFGLVGMIVVFLAVATSFVDSGFSSALIQRRQLTEEDKTSVFLFNLSAGLAMAAMMFWAAPAIAWFYKQPILTGLTRLLALNLFISACGSVQFTLLRRQLDFKTQWKVGMVASAISGAVAVVLAWRGYGVWSLAVQANISALISTLMVWSLVPWRPSAKASIESLRSMFRFGSRVLASGLIGTVFERVQLLLIGKVFGPADLGYYTRAYSTQQVPASVFQTVVSKVTFPMFSTIAGDRDRLKAAMRKCLVTIGAVVIPMLVGLALLAKPVVIVLFGAKWLPCVPYLRILALAGALWPLHVANLDVLMAAGRSDLFLRAEVVKRVLIALSLAVSVPISVMAMVWAMLVVSVLCYGVNAAYAQRVIDYSMGAQVKDLLRPLLCTVAMAFIVGALTVPALLNAPLLLLVGVTTGAVVYLAMSFLLRVEAVTHTAYELVGTLSRGSPCSQRVEQDSMVRE